MAPGRRHTSWWSPGRYPVPMLVIVDQGFKRGGQSADEVPDDAQTGAGRTDHPSQRISDLRLPMSPPPDRHSRAATPAEAEPASGASESATSRPDARVGVAGGK